MQVYSRQRICWYAAVCILAATAAVSSACGGDDDKGGGNGSTVPNGSRLAWRQMASSVTQLQSMTYRIYVDGVQMSLSNTTCGSQSTASGYECSGRLPTLTPGKRVIELTSIRNGVESVRSATLTITILASSTQSLAPEPSPSPEEETRSSAPSTVCVASSGECYNARLVASGVENPHALSPMVDGRLLFIENGTAVRVIEGDHLWAEPALLPPHPGVRIVGLAVDRSPEGKGAVFVAWTEPTSDGQQLSLTRYRELNNVLGQGATIVTGLPVTDHANVPLAVDGDGLVYLAMPAPSAGQILRFTRSGAIPETNPRSSPILAEGYSKPIGLAIDSTHNRVWLAGDHAMWPFQLAMFSVTGEAQSSWPLRPSAPVGSPRTIVPTSLNLLTSASPEGESWLIVGSSGQLSGGNVTPDGRIEGFGPLRFEPSMTVYSAAQGPLDSWYLVAGADMASASILRLTRR